MPEYQKDQKSIDETKIHINIEILKIMLSQSLISGRDVGKYAMLGSAGGIAYIFSLSQNENFPNADLFTPMVAFTIARIASALLFASNSFIHEESVNDLQEKISKQISGHEEPEVVKYHNLITENMRRKVLSVTIFGIGFFGFLASFVTGLITLFMEIG